MGDVIFYVVHFAAIALGVLGWLLFSSKSSDLFVERAVRKATEDALTEVREHRDRLLAELTVHRRREKQVCELLKAAQPESPEED